MDLKLKHAYIALTAVLFLSGCAASRAERQFKNEVTAILTYSVKNNEPCNITCGKLKSLVEYYKSKSGLK